MIVITLLPKRRADDQRLSMKRADYARSQVLVAAIKLSHRKDPRRTCDNSTIENKMQSLIFFRIIPRPSRWSSVNADGYDGAADSSKKTSTICTRTLIFTIGMPSLKK